MFLEHWNRQKNISDIPQRFSYLLDEGIAKKCKKNHDGFFFKYILYPFERHMDRPYKSENIFGI